MKDKKKHTGIYHAYPLMRLLGFMAIPSPFVGLSVGLSLLFGIGHGFVLDIRGVFIIVGSVMIVWLPIFFLTTRLIVDDKGAMYKSLFTKYRTPWNNIVEIDFSYNGPTGYSRSILSLILDEPISNQAKRGFLGSRRVLHGIPIGPFCHAGGFRRALGETPLGDELRLYIPELVAEAAHR